MHSAITNGYTNTMKSEFRRLMEDDPLHAKNFLQREINKGKTTEQLCKMLGLESTRAIYRIKKELGLIRDAFKPTEEELRLLTTPQLAKKYGVSTARVYKYRAEQRRAKATGPKEDLGTSDQSSDG